MNRIKEIFVPTSIDTVDGLIGFLIQAVEQHGGDPSTIKVVDTDIAIPNVWSSLTSGRVGLSTSI